MSKTYEIDIFVLVVRVMVKFSPVFILTIEDCLYVVILLLESEGGGLSFDRGLPFTS